MNGCTTIEGLLPDLARGMLSGDELRRAEEHVRGCASCAKNAEELREFFARRPAPEEVPAGYWTALLPRVRRRLEAPSAPALPGFVVRWLAPAAAAVMLTVIGTELVRQPAAPSLGGASALLSSLPESDLSLLAEEYDAKAVMTLPADAGDASESESEAWGFLEELVGAEAGADAYAYVDNEILLRNLPEEDETKLLSMLEEN